MNFFLPVFFKCPLDPGRGARAHPGWPGQLQRSPTINCVKFGPKKGRKFGYFCPRFSPLFGLHLEFIFPPTPPYLTCYVVPPFGFRGGPFLRTVFLICTRCIFGLTHPPITATSNCFHITLNVNEARKQKSGENPGNLENMAVAAWLWLCGCVAAAVIITGSGRAYLVGKLAKLEGPQLLLAKNGRIGIFNSLHL